MSTKKVVINCCFGGFGLSEAAYEKLIEYGVPVRAYTEQKRDPKTRLFLPEPLNEGEVIFDRDLPVAGSLVPERVQSAMRRLGGRYWETFLRSKREHPLLIRVVEELGQEANGRHASLRVVEIPSEVEYTIEEYDGVEHIAEVHRTWGRD